jgi:di/tricarboxylate transporter
MVRLTQPIAERAALEALNDPMMIVFAVLGAASLLFASGRVRLDIVALLAVLALILTGVLTPREALAGFGDPVVILVAALLVVGETITRTGIAHEIGRWMTRTAGNSETRLLLLLMLTAAILGSVMSSTAIVAIFIPVVITISTKTNLNASRLLMPLSFAALISGMLTLIATTPNLIVAAELASAGYEPFSFFSFAPVGLSILAVGIVYMLLLGRRLLPGEAVSAPKSTRQTMDDLVRGFGLSDHRQRLRVLPGSPLEGQSLAQAHLSSYGARVAGVERAERVGPPSYIPTPNAQIELHVGDVLAMSVAPAELEALCESKGLEVLPVSERNVDSWRKVFGMALVLVHPESTLIGRTTKESEFRTHHGLHIQGLRRAGKVIADFEEKPLAAGDTLLVQGPWRRIDLLGAESHDFVVLMLPQELDEVAPARRRAPVAILILLGMVTLSALEIVPVVVAVMLAALAAVFTRCLSMDDGYRSIHWSSVVLIAGMLPLADALSKTGGIDLIVETLMDGFGDAGPYAMMSILFIMTASLGLVLSNTATAVIMAPIAIRAAEILAVSPHPFAMVIAIAASAAFVTPVSTPVVTLVVDPGGYRFGDFVKVGGPLLLLTWAVAIFVIPVFFPF